MPMVWDADADRKLLLAILKTQAVKVDSEAVAADLSTDTSKCTPRAVEERLKKLKKMSSDAPGEVVEDNTPSKKATPAKIKPKATPRRKKAVMEEDNDDDDEASPSKRPRRATKAVKTEPVEEDHEDEYLKDALVKYASEKKPDDEA